MIFAITDHPHAIGQWRTGIQAHSVPYGGVKPTVQVMTKLADQYAHSPEVRGVTEAVCRSIYAKDYLSEIAAIYYHNCNPQNVRYIRDPARVELVKAPPVVIRTKQADCDEMQSTQASEIKNRLRAPYLAGMMSNAGNVEVDAALAGYGGGGLTHTFARVRDPRGSGRMVVLDPVAGPLTPRMLRNIKEFKSGGFL